MFANGSSWAKMQTLKMDHAIVAEQSCGPARADTLCSAICLRTTNSLACQ